MKRIIKLILKNKAIIAIVSVALLLIGTISANIYIDNYIANLKSTNEESTAPATPIPTPTIVSTPTPAPRKPITASTPSPTSVQKPSFDWSAYRASRIKDLKGALKIIEDQIAYYEKQEQQFTAYLLALVEDAQQGLITADELQQRRDNLKPAADFVLSTLAELRQDKEKYTNLIRRFENGENISPAEEKAILGN